MGRFPNWNAYLRADEWASSDFNPNPAVILDLIQVDATRSENEQPSSIGTGNNGLPFTVQKSQGVKHNMLGGLLI